MVRPDRRMGKRFKQTLNQGRLYRKRLSLTHAQFGERVQYEWFICKLLHISLWDTDKAMNTSLTMSQIIQFGFKRFLHML